MKFLAILKDSLREAVDAKVFYVMVGLSVLVTAITATLSFKPRNPEKILVLLTLPLYSDTADFDPVKFQRLLFDPSFKAYKINSATTLDGSPDGPDHPYLVTLGIQCNSLAEARKMREAPQATYERIRTRFGVFAEKDATESEKLQVLEVTDVRLAKADAENAAKEDTAREVLMEVETKPTAMTRRLWPHEPSLFFGAVPLSFLQEAPLALQLFLLENTVINGLGAWVTVLISVIITAFFIPNMLRKGTIDLLLVKPVKRVTLLLYKYVGGLLFIFLNTAVAVIGVWIALGLRSGIWAPSFLLTIPILTFSFAILYAVSTLFAVLTKSPVAAILLTCGVWFVLFIVGVLNQLGDDLKEQKSRYEEKVAKGELAAPVPPIPQGGDPGEKKKARGPRFGAEEEPQFNPDNWFFTTVRAIHFVLPRAKDLDKLMGEQLMRDLLTANQIKERSKKDSSITWGESLGVSLAFIVVMLGLSCWRFAARDY